MPAVTRSRGALAVALAFLAAGCMSDDPAAPPDGLRVLALGDSYTVGEGVPAGDRWPDQLAGRLRQSGLAVAPPDVVAVTGWTTDELAAGIDEAGPAGPYDVVTLLIGVNDQYRGLGVSGYRERVGALLDRAVAFAGGRPGRVVAVSFPDWGVTPFGAADARGPARIAREVDAFNAAAQAEAERRGVAWVDVTALSRRQGDRVVGDGLHPDAAAYAAWTDRIEPAARRALAAGGAGDGPAGP